MSLTCGDFYGGEDGDWWYFHPDNYSTLDTPRGRRCWSCKVWIPVGSLVGKFTREALCDPDSVDYRIYGEEKPLSPKYMCEACTDQFFNLTELGYCIGLPANMDELRREHVEITQQRRNPDAW